MEFNNKENEKYLSSQLLTYIGNKRELLSEIEKEIIYVKERLNKEKLTCLDLFSGSGVVARLLKKHSSLIIANDLEEYSKILNECFLSNKNEFNLDFFHNLLEKIEEEIKNNPIEGIIRRHYSPKDDEKITPNDRVFYTNSNAIYIDSFRHYIDKLVPENYKKYFLALLLIKASIHVNTCGIFRGFYKDKDTGIGKFGGKAENNLSRIKGNIKIEAPVLSEFESEYLVFNKDANILAKELKNLDLVYLDPPYNLHPYGSNYFMLNLILKNRIDSEISEISGIPTNWNHSIYNKKKKALAGLKDIVSNLDAKFILISYNNEGFISYEDMENMLKEFGKVKTTKNKHNTFKGARNLNNRSIHTNEYLFLVEKFV